MPPLRVAVIGTGAFGRNHLRVYRELEQAHPELVTLAALVEPDPTRREAAATTYNIPAFATVAEMLEATSTTTLTPDLSSRPEAALFATLTPELSSRPEAALFAAAVERPATPPASPQPPAPFNFEPNFEPIHAASICVPTTHHAEVAAQLLRNNIDILIEKPFAATLAEADHILALSQKHNRVVAIGHLERFNPAVTATIAALNKPMFFEAHRLSIFTARSLDVDVVLDLMIHDLDIVLSLTNSPVREVRAVGLPILSRKTDIANVRVEFANGCVANFTASRVSTEQVRKLRLFQPHQYLSLDFARQELLSINVDPAIIAASIDLSSRNLGSSSRSLDLSSRSLGVSSHNLELSSRSEAERSAVFSQATNASDAKPSDTQVAQGFSLGSHKLSTEAGALAPKGQPQHPSPGLTLKKSDIPKGEPLRLELEDFLHAIRTRTQPRVPAEAGRAALALALEINEQIAAHAKKLQAAGE